MAKYLLLLLIAGVLFPSNRLSASPQMPDYIIYKADTIATYNLLVEQYLKDNSSSKPDQLLGLSFRDGSSFNCWRGYQAIYKIDNDSLFVIDLINCGERMGGKKIDKAASVEKMKAVFGNKLIGNKVFITWFTGDLNFPLTKKILRWDGVFYTTYEKEKIVSVAQGKVTKTEDVDNYIDDPKSLNRRYQTKISDIFFKEIEKIKFKNTDDCDCSNKYLVTIGVNGKVSKVRLLKDNDGDAEEQEDETRYCVNPIFKALKKLKFDIIKNRGKPVAEDIYMELWFDDDKVENWTR